MHTTSLLRYYNVTDMTTYLLKDFPGALGGLNKRWIIIIGQLLGGFQHIGALLRQPIWLMAYAKYQALFRMLCTSYKISTMIPT